MTIRVVIVDDHRVVRDGLCYLLSQEPDIDVVGEAGDGRQALNVVAATRPDVVLLDLYMPGVDGHGVLTALRDTLHPAAIVVLTSATDDEHLVHAMQGGATSYLLKTAPAEDVVNAIRAAAAGTATLSPDLLTRLTQALRRPPAPDPLRPPPGPPPHSSPADCSRATATQGNDHRGPRGHSRPPQSTC